MPFVHVSGLPDGIATQDLFKLRAQIIDAVVKSIDAPYTWVRAFFPEDKLAGFAPTECETIWVTIDTAMFSQKIKTGMSKEVVDALVQKTLIAITEVIWNFFDGKYEVEIAVNNLNKEWMYLKLPK